MNTAIRAEQARVGDAGIRSLVHDNGALGPRAEWPEALRAIVDLMLGSHLPMFLAWGPQLRLLYNDACVALLCERHPQAFGQPLAQVCSGAWEPVLPLVSLTMAGKTARHDDIQLNGECDGREQRRYVTLSCSPVLDAGATAGVFCVLTDITARVLAEQQHGFHLKLTTALRQLTDPLEIMTAASTLMGRYFAVARVGYGEIDASGSHISVERDWTDGSVASLAGATYALDAFGADIMAPLAAGEVVCLDDIALDARSAPYAQAYAQVGVRALVTVPIMEGGRLSGVFFLHEPRPRYWSEREVGLAEDVARQTRETLRRARVEETLRDETRILEVLNRTGQALASTLDLTVLLQAITDATTQLSGARFGALVYNGIDERGEPTQLHTLCGIDRAAFASLDEARPGSLLNPAFDSQQPIRSADIGADPRYGAGRLPPGVPVRSYLAVPVVSRSGAILGGLVFGHPEPGVFNERSERIVAGVAAQAAVAMDNARLYELARKAARERDALLQSERAARVEAERLSRMKDEFLAMLAHELRNPLAPISSSAGLLGIQFRDEPRIRQASAIISRQVKHMSRLIDDLLDVSRVTRGLVTLQVGEMDLCDVVRSALDQTRPLFEEKSHRVELTVPDCPVSVRGDATRLIQAVANILNNAAKYTPPAGTIRVTLAARDTQARIEVRDNGSGMPPDLLPSVFELFTQGARTLARSQGGLGLGLALVKKLVDLHGGEVSAHSEGVGLGSTFVITLPQATVAPAGADEIQRAPGAPGVPEAAAYRPLRIIVVDDNEDAADSLGALLQAQGHAVMVEYSARGALRRATGEHPDAMVVDIGLPDMDGYQLAALLRAQPGTRDTCLIAATGYGQDRDRERARAAGFAHYLVKPVDMAALLKILQALASRPVAR